MKYPQLRLVFDRKNQAKENKSALVQIEIMLDKRKKYISTGVKVLSNQWKNNQVCNRIDAMELTAQIESKVKDIRSWLVDLDKSGQEFSFDKLNSFIEQSNISSGSFIEFIENRIDERRIKYSTKRQHYVLVSVLREFGKIKLFADITLKNIQLFDDYLKKRVGSQQTVHGYHKRLKVYVREAMKFDLIKSDPYQLFSVPRGESKKRKYLDFEEMKKLEAAEISDLAIERARDCFVFCCFTGLSYSDLEKFNFETDTIEVSGKYFIQDERTKTGSEYRIQILSPAMRILQKYNYKLPVISNQKYNQYLKLVAKYAELNKSLTSHMARHTFAVFALNNGVRIEVVSKMLAHSDIKTTQIYAKILQKEVEDGFDILEKKLI